MATNRVERGAADPPGRQTYGEVNTDILAMLSRPGKWWWILFGLSVAGIGLLAFSWGNQIINGIGLSGLSSPVGWGAYITTFVFWVGIAHSGTLISAILFLFRARWRQSIYRAAEAMTVFAVMTAGLFPLIHLGRVWHAYWLFPYPNERMLWPNFRSPLVWDVFAVTTYFTVSSLFFLLGLIPDIAAARDQAKKGTLRKKFYSSLSFGWRGRTGSGTTSARPTSSWPPSRPRWCSRCTRWCRGTSPCRSCPGGTPRSSPPTSWPGHLLGGGHGDHAHGPIRKIFGLEKYLTIRHFDAMAKLSWSRA
jgi:hypothetical protein